MPPDQAHDPQYLDEDLQARIERSVQSIAEGADVEATLQQLVLGLQHDYALFREALADLLQEHPHCLMFGFNLKTLAETHQLDPAVTEALDDLVAKHDDKGILILFGGLADNARFETDERFQRIWVCSSHQAYPQDPLTDVCRLYHEYGHFLSRKAGFWTAQFREAKRVLQAQSPPSVSEASKTSWSIGRAEVAGSRRGNPSFAAWPLSFAHASLHRV